MAAGEILELLRAAGTTGWIAWIVVLVILLLQNRGKDQDRALKAYQSALRDMGDQIDELRKQRREDREEHIKTIELLNAGHQREYELEKAHRERCEVELADVKHAIRLLRGEE